MVWTRVCSLTKIGVSGFFCYFIWMLAAFMFAVMLAISVGRTVSEVWSVWPPLLIVSIPRAFASSSCNGGFILCPCPTKLVVECCALPLDCKETGTSPRVAL